MELVIVAVVVGSVAAVVVLIWQGLTVEFIDPLKK